MLRLCGLKPPVETAVIEWHHALNQVKPIIRRPMAQAAHKPR